MVSLISFILIMLSSTVTVLPFIVLVEVISALALPARGASERPTSKGRARIAVLIPAHNESTALLPAICDVHSQLRPGDRLLVVADNCTDDTAEVAAKAGALVARRDDLTKIGKGYALDFGVRALRTDPPDVVLMVDADCRLAADAIDWLTYTCVKNHRPVQARYMMSAPEDAGLNLRVAEFAWRLKNWLRPLGLSNLNLPCQLTGSGMAFPWDVIVEAQLANGWLVEDLKLGVDLALAGYPPVFCSSAICTSEFASTHKGLQSQRQRWEHGHVQTISQAPRAVLAAIRKFNFAPLAQLADLIVPPLSLLVLTVGGMFIVTGIATLIGAPPAALLINVAGGTALSIAIFLTWLSHGRDLLPLRKIGLVVFYIASKMPLYARIFSGRARNEWVRTDRGSSELKH